MKESATCGELAAKWNNQAGKARPMLEQIAELFEERDLKIASTDIEKRVLVPALKEFNPKAAEGFSIDKNPGLAMMTAMYLNNNLMIALPDSKKVSAREKKIGEQVKLAQSADEAEQVVVTDTKISLATELETKLKTALKMLR